MYKGYAELGYSALVGGKTGHSVLLQTSHGVKKGALFVGGGFGIEQNVVSYDEYYTNMSKEELSNLPDITKKYLYGWSVPVFFNLRSDWSKSIISPVIDTKVGLSLGEILGPFAELGFGGKMNLVKDFKLSVMTYIKAAYDPGIVTDSPSCLEGSFYNLGLKVGIEF